MILVKRVCVKRIGAARRRPEGKESKGLLKNGPRYGISTGNRGKGKMQVLRDNTGRGERKKGK